MPWLRGSRYSVIAAPPAAPTAIPLSISGTPVLTGRVGVAYAGFSLGSAGGAPPRRFSFSPASGPLPGIAVGSVTGLVSGSPTVGGTFQDVVFRVTDDKGDTADLGPFEYAIASSAAPVVRRVVTFQGNSWLRSNEQEISRLGTGNVVATDRVTNQTASILGVTEYMTPGQLGVTVGVINAGYGGQKSNTIKTNVSALIAAEPIRAQDAAIIGDGRNDTPDVAGDIAILAAVDAQLALYPHDRKIVWAPYGSTGGISVGSSAIGSWVRSKKVLWAYREDGRRKCLFELHRYFQGLAPNGSNGTAVDDLAAASDSLIPSLRASAAPDQQHPNYLAAPLWAAPLAKVTKAMWNEGVEAQDVSIKVPYDCAAGTKIKVFFKGHVTGFAISQDDAASPGIWTAAGMVPGKSDEGYLERTDLSPGALPGILNLQVTATAIDTSGGAHTDVADVRILPSVVGAASTAPKGVYLPRDTHATAASRRWPFMVFENSPWATAGTKFSFACLMKMAEDGTIKTLWSQSSTRVLIQTTTGNKWTIRIQDSTGADILNWTTITTNFTVAAGAFTLFFDIDMNGGAPVANCWANIGGADVNIAPATTLNPQNGAMSLTSIPYLFNIGNAQCNWKGSVFPLWAADDVFAGGGFGLAANRRLICDLAGPWRNLGAAGVVGGITPEVYLRGLEGDVLSGLNSGSGPQLGFNDNWLRGFGANSSDPRPF